MSLLPTRAGPSGHFLATLLEQPALLTRIQRLDATALTRLIRHVGLEDSGEIVALATTEQLCDVFDEDLWRGPRPGEQETFDARRFSLWLEVLLESGEDLVANKLADLPEELLVLGLQRNVLVIDIDALAVEMSERVVDVDLVEKALESCLYEEIDTYRIIARRDDHWDAIVTALLALDQNHHGLLMRILEQCCWASTEYIEDNGGLYEVLSADEVLECDAAADREDRRAKRGYVSPTDAASFLSLPRVMEREEALSDDTRDPITKAYFRTLDDKPKAAPKRERHEHAHQVRFEGWLRNAGVVDAPAPPMLPSGPEETTSYRSIMTTLAADGGELYATRLEELAYLSNVLMAGSSLAGRTFRPVEAAEAVMETCNLGLEWACAGAKANPEQVVRTRPADALFRVGWHVLFWDVSMAAARALRGRVRDKARVDRAIEDGKPWQILGLLESAGLPPDQQELMAGLLDRFPSLPPELGRGVFIGSLARVREVMGLARRI